METTLKPSDAIPSSRPDHPRAFSDDRLFEVWKEYEEVAKHFNDLLIRLRTQALGGVAAISAFATIITKGDLIPSLRWELLIGVLLLLVFFWVAVWILDALYYNRLLYGAVTAILEIEQASQKGEPVSGLRLSTRIEQAVAKGRGLAGGQRDHPTARSTAIRGGVPVHTFYALVLAALLVGLVLSTLAFRSLPIK